MERKNYVKEIKRIPIEEVTKRLGLKLTRTGNSLQGHCPAGHPSKNGRCFSVNTSDNYFNCFHCGEAGDLISLVEIVKEIPFKEAMSWLSDEFNVSMPADVKDSNHDVDPEFYQRAALFDAIFEYGKHLLYQPDGSDARNYLLNERGYSIDALKQTEWISFPSDIVIKSHLIGKFPDAGDQIQKLHLNSYKEKKSWAAFPYRNREGIITGFLKRALTPKGYNLTNYKGESISNLRWHSTAKTNKHDLFNLHRCSSFDILLIVEGYPDAMRLPTMGLENIVAVGQGKLSKSHLEGLEEFGIRTVIISLDNDASGIENTTSAIRLLLKHSHINVLVVKPDALSPHKDPDEYVDANGIDAYHRLVNDSITGSKWLAMDLLKNYDLTRDLEKQKALDAACVIRDEIKSRLASDQFLDAVADEFKMDKETITEYIGDYHERSERARLSEEYKKLNAEAEAHRRKGELEHAAKLIEERGLELKNELYKTRIKSLPPLAERLLEKHNDEKNRKADILGYSLKKFSQLCKHIDGVQPGLYLLGAETNVGKTAMLTNLSLDIADSNDDVRIVYFSMDDPWNVIINRYLGILTSINLNQVQRRQDNYADADKLKKAYDYLMAMSKAGQLYIKDQSEVNTYDQIEAVIREHYDEDLVVFLDGLYNVEVASSGSIREINIERANKLKTLVDTYHIPIICTAELRKKTREDGKNKAPTIHDFMETGKFGYNANVAWLLSSDYNYKEDNEIPVKLNYEKNKLSHYKGYQELTFIRNKGIVKEGNCKVHNMLQNLAPQTLGEEDFC